MPLPPVPAISARRAPLKHPGGRLRGLCALMAGLGLLGGLALPARAQEAAPSAPAASAAAAAPTRSALDGVLFYQVLVSELELRAGNPALAYQVMMEAAKRSRDEALYRRAVDIALGAQAGEQAAEALRQWRQALPQSRQAAEIDTQMLVALGRFADARKALESFIELTPEAERPAAIASLPRLVLAGAKPQDTARMLDETLAVWRSRPATLASAQIATAAAWLTAGERERALGYVRQASRRDPADPTPALLALELMKDTPAAEEIVRAHLASPMPAPAVRAGYVRRLSTAQRYGEALREARALTRAAPEMGNGWLMQGALEIEAGEPAPARVSLQRYLDLRSVATPPLVRPQTSGEDEDDDSSEAGDLLRRGDEQELLQAFLMLAQASEQLRDYAAAQTWLERAAELQPQDSATVLSRRASLLMRQGRLDEARALLQRLPQDTPEQQRARLLTETQLLRDARQWQAAHELLAQATARLPDDADLLYEQALLAEKLRRYDEMETLLRRVITLRPEQQHAYNALGYSLAERGQRLPEARELIARALALTPGDPYITDSLGWVEFRMGRAEEAARLLRQAYGQRPDVEIGAHLGEVLWSMGRRDEARQVWRESRERDAGNEVLIETLERLKVKP